MIMKWKKIAQNIKKPNFQLKKSGQKEEKATEEEYQASFAHKSKFEKMHILLMQKAWTYFYRIPQRSI